jgi:carbonic anhydrase
MMARMRIFALPLFAAGCAAAPHAVHWSYDTEGGPAAWSRLSPGFAACGAGRAQSPIALAGGLGAALGGAAADTRAPRLAYQPSRIEALHNGHTVEVRYDPGSTLTLDGQSFSLVQLHFHHPSEHTLDGRAFPLEMHLVHRAADGHLAVLSVLVAEGAENRALAPLWAALPAASGERSAPTATVNAAEILPPERALFRYSGSLTTPPCSEGVRWMVLRSPIEMSAAQLTAFAKLFPDNHRPVQALNGRTVERTGP